MSSLRFRPNKEKLLDSDKTSTYLIHLLNNKATSRPRVCWGQLWYVLGKGGVVVCAVRLTPEGRYQAVLFISFKASSTVPG